MRIAVGSWLSALSVLTVLTLVSSAGTRAASTSQAVTPTPVHAPGSVIEHLGAVDLRSNAPHLHNIARERLDKMVPIITARDHQHVAIALVTGDEACAGSVSAFLKKKRIPHDIVVDASGEPDEVHVRLVRK
jgi:hypothetical protein